MRYVVVGAGGFSREVADLLVVLGHEPVAFYTEHPECDSIRGTPVINCIEMLPAHDAAVIAIGDSIVKKRLWKTFGTTTVLPTLIHPSAHVSPNTTIGDGCILMENTTIKADVTLGDGVLVNVGTVVGHDCQIGDFAHFAPGALIGGGCTIGEGAFCAIGSTLLPRIAVGAWATCAAGSVVTSDVDDHILVMGVPARAKRKTIADKKQEPYL